MADTRGWQPIETAPRDGTEIIGCYFKDWGEGTVSRYGPWTVAFDGKKWRSSWDGSQVIEYMSDFGTEYKEPDCDPTHWQPFPPPPTPGGDRNMTKLEEVARAIGEVTYTDNGNPVSLRFALEGVFGHGGFGFVLTDALLESAARAAIEALRTATPEMIGAGEMAVDDGETYSCAAKAEAAYWAMIDAILSEGEA